MAAEFRLREMRERAGMSVENVATLVSEPCLWLMQIESGYVAPTWPLACNIAIALGCTLDELAGIDGTDDEICGRR